MIAVDFLSRRVDVVMRWFFFKMKKKGTTKLPLILVKRKRVRVKDGKESKEKWLQGNAPSKK